MGHPDAVVMQLSLALPAPIARQQRLWFLSAHPDDLLKLCEALRAGGGALIDACTGLQAIAPYDLVLLRSGDDRYIPFGCAGPLATLDGAGRIGTQAIIDLASPVGQRGRDLLCFTPGRAAAQQDVPAGTPIENLFRLLRARSHQLSPELRTHICGQALSTLDRDQDVLAAILHAQATRLQRKMNTRPTASDLDCARRDALRQARLGWIERALDPQPLRPRPVLRDLFGAPVSHGTPRDMSFDAFRVAAICVPINPDREACDFSRFCDHPTLTLDEFALSQAIGQVTSFRILAAAALVERDRHRLSVCFDYEVRQRFDRLVPKHAISDLSYFRLESIAGNSIGPVRSAYLGERVEFDVPRQWTTPNRVRGCVVFSAGGGPWARQSIDLPLSA